MDEDTLDSIQSRSSEFEVHIASNETPAVTCISSSKAIEVILDDAKIEVTEDNIKEIDYGICSTDLIFAFVWLGLSLAILESHQVDSGVIQRVVVRATEPILEHFGNNTVLYASATGNIVFETFQMINAFWAEVVCSFLGSSCIA